ncbi:sigma-70 family RNA polymerase sigma factor [Pseudenhygromyxa sp. WMMC2535]|uniref:sigma-70 family RNA polymerase sigma factor n=1 Tax=Pseudenhygromyxa sp. WMMC2535 TaxID=2712867 RepID=UPI00155557F3|nr:sigma-70 family RNA polymerase sigma factor [Pseudenhygromyxa sp. WMMC2535]
MATAKTDASAAKSPARAPRPTAAEHLALVEAAQAGDRRAFARLYRSHGRLVHGVLLSRLPRAELRDAMQEVFTVALTKLGELREPGSFAAWLAAIARNYARDWFKRHANRSEIAHEPQAVEGAAGSPDIELGGAGGQQRLADALSLLGAMGELSEDYREILVLRFVEGFSGPEIAAALDMTPGSVRVKLHRGVSRLRDRLSAEPASGGCHE